MSDSIDVKLARIEAKIDSQASNLETLNEMIWKSNGSKPSLLERTESQETRIQSLEEDTNRRLNLIQGVILALIPMALGALIAAFITPEKENTTTVPVGHSLDFIKF